MLPGRKLHVSLKVRSKEIILKKKYVIIHFLSLNSVHLCVKNNEAKCLPFTLISVIKVDSQGEKHENKKVKNRVCGEARQTRKEMNEE